MCKLFTKYEKEIEQYCLENSLDFEKAKRMPQCWGKNDIWLQYHDPQKGKNGLKDETPAPIVLIITINNGRVEFEKTEFTEKYLKKAS
ncbi:MAG: hypothetical protein U0K87_03950 [Ruminococcus sp.]|nr:hypothetical protein [Ruminococcus sp.]